MKTSILVYLFNLYYKNYIVEYGRSLETEKSKEKSFQYQKLPNSLGKR